MPRLSPEQLALLDETLTEAVNACLGLPAVERPVYIGQYLLAKLDSTPLPTVPKGDPSDATVAKMHALAEILERAVNEGAQQTHVDPVRAVAACLLEAGPQPDQRQQTELEKTQQRGPTPSVEEVAAAADRLNPTSQDTYEPANEAQRDADEAAAERQLAADEAEVKKECEAPLPQGSTWSYQDDRNGVREARYGDELEKLFAYTGVISVRWLIDFIEGRVIPERRGVLPAWQELPAEAFVSVTELRKSSYTIGLPIAVFSYGWASRRHPDPTGEQLRRALPAFKSMVNGQDHGWGNRVTWKVGDTPDWGLVIDYSAYPQNLYTGPDPKGDSRTPYQRRRFDKGLRSVNRWYGSSLVTTLVCDWDMPEGSENTHSIFVRGWCRFERALSSITKNGWCYLHLSRLPEGAEHMPWWSNNGKGIAGTCSMGADRPAPEPPPAFERSMLAGMESREIRFTNGKDATGVCIPQYEEGFLRQLGTAAALEYDQLNWGPAEAERLAAAFAYVHDQEGVVLAVEKLTLNMNRLGNAGVRAIGRAIQAGHLPRLKRLRIHGNGADAETREWIKGTAEAAGCIYDLMDANPLRP